RCATHSGISLRGWAHVRARHAGERRDVPPATPESIGSAVAGAGVAGAKLWGYVRGVAWFTAFLRVRTVAGRPEEGGVYSVIW
ncbi:MAG: hypothetical protein Q8M17_04960, partial [Actinomycetota bacterium]|nr:hypothetical protein [Actinomycetota bacterium]